MLDPLMHLAHDHGNINRRVRALGATLHAGGTASDVVDSLVELREELFLHFAREEEGLFPFVAEVMPAFEVHVQTMATAHDTICGAVARMVYLAESSAPAAAIALVFERFAAAYAQHATTERELLDSLDQQLTPPQRARLGGLVEGL